MTTFFAICAALVAVVLIVVGALGVYGWLLCWWESRDYRWPR